MSRGLTPEFPALVAALLLRESGIGSATACSAYEGEAATGAELVTGVARLLLLRPSPVVPVCLDLSGLRLPSW
jgi:hypothetical protein